MGRPSRRSLVLALFRSHLRARAAMAGAVILAAAGLAVLTGPAAQAATARSFSCQGSLGEAFTQRTVTGQLTATARPYDVVVTQTGSGVVESSRATRAGDMGPSDMHPGYWKWNVTGPNPDGNYYRLHLAPVLPGAGGFFDAELDIEFGVGGAWQIPMFDCTVTGGPFSLTRPPSPRTFTCQGDLGEAFTQRTVSGFLTATSRPYDVTVTATSTGTVESFRAGLAGRRGASPLHAGYTEWAIGGPNPSHNYYRLSTPPVLPAAGGFFDADLDIEFNTGLDGAWQIAMFDCTVALPAG